MQADNPAHRSYLFTVRLWAEPRGDGSAEWRGQVRHVMTGEVRYFREWAYLGALLLALLPDAVVDDQHRTSDRASGAGGLGGGLKTF